MKLNKAVYFKDGKSLVVTDQEAEAIKARLVAGDRFIEVAGELISTDNIGRVGHHEMTAENNKMQVANVERALISAGKIEMVEKLRALKRVKAIEGVKREESLALPMSSEEEENGSPMFYLNECGEKIYS